ncbi:MAG: efflux RND transporter periplasmic adaptor subunit [Myxococcales bacterium]
MRATVAVCASLALAGLACGKKVAAPYKTEPVTRGSVNESVSATGDVSALVTVSVGSQVSGIVDKLYVDFNSPVKKGQLLATLDARLFQAALQKTDASVASARAGVQKAQAALADSQRLVSRDQELFKGGLIARSELDTAMATNDGNAASLAGAKAAVLQANADRAQAAANLAFTKITSPIDGVVVSRSVDAGQTVAAALQAPTLFVIANDLTKMQILANVDQADVGKVHEGEDAKFTVDAYPGEVFKGHISQVRQAATTTNNVVTYAAVIQADNPDRKLRQGMTAAVTIVAANHDDVLRVPNAALRVHIDIPAPASIPLVAEARAATGNRPRRDPRAAIVYKLVNGNPQAVNVTLGLSDGQRTEVSGDLAENDQVIVSGGNASSTTGNANAAQRPQRGARGPF